MSHAKLQSAAFLSFAALVAVAAGAALAYSWPLAQNAGRAEAASLVGEAQSASAAEAANDYELAHWLDPGSESAAIGLAQAQLAAYQPQQALDTLNSAGQGSKADDLRLRANIELGRTDAAAGLATLTAHQNAPDAAQRLARVQAGNLPLAAELAAAGLPESSSALLMKLPTSFERNLLLARLDYTRHTTASLNEASDLLAGAVAMNPGDITAHRLYAKVLADRGLTADSAKQSSLVNSLDTKRP